MSRIVYVNGSYVPESEAKISVFDRGFLFADGVYEVTAVLSGKLVDFAGHMKRLRRSLSELALPSPGSDEMILAIHRELLSRNGIEEGLVYMQISRGAADRDFAFPPENTEPSLVLFTQAKTLRETPASKTGITVATVPDQRWRRCDIKTVQLLYPSMAKMDAKSRGADDAWMVDGDGFVTEGTSNNAYIVKQDGTVVTRHLSNDILHGITRATVVGLAEQEGRAMEIRPFSVAEAREADEAFVTSASSFVMPVVSIDGTKIGSGSPGPFARRLRERYIAHAEETAL
ncbi:Aminotransferase class IV, putative D-alanine aminotransferase [Fulvimarina pelagi HTCC2506]|uniref:Probable branched-chain-amino-acid aminotransferase n=2 Tax=Fulvimarina pelagi TaxID=217511 RepID=Q0FYB1_9HYPH|nr:D-amino-acid transaminase [Fulvimarina pelagi]EAU40084.1 Aminotransferase class IV, putative D-alanine aminotransferase [Fulvimarina pelagi HTCC2506]BAT31123.1 D-alanine aminotransferase [Fulvimarina pelagi]